MKSRNEIALEVLKATIPTAQNLGREANEVLAVYSFWVADAFLAATSKTAEEIAAAVKQIHGR